MILTEVFVMDFFVITSVPWQTLLNVMFYCLVLLPDLCSSNGDILCNSLTDSGRKRSPHSVKQLDKRLYDSQGKARPIATVVYKMVAWQGE